MTRLLRKVSKEFGGDSDAIEQAIGENKNTSTELRQALEELGINVLEYNGTKDSRVEAMNSVKELRFSSQETDLDKKRITIGMPDSERTEILQTKVITAEVYEKQADEAVEREREYLESGQLGLIEAALERIADEFGVFTGYDIKDVGVKLEFSKSNLHESVSKKITPEVMAKLMPVLKTAVENAIGVESHTNRYFYDTDIVRFDNLVGGYVEGEEFIPVRFGLKHRRNGEALLYVIIDQQKVPLNKTKAEVVRIAGTQSVQPEVPRSAFRVSIADIVPFVNSGDLLRYLPDDMLTENQKQIKWDAIADTIVRTNKKNDAKPGGEVGLDKVNTAVIPDNVSTELRQALEEQGINVIEYKHGVKADRTKAVNSVKDLMFSSQETDLDTKTDSAYDSAKKETEQEVIPYGQDGKAEDHASFIRRMHEGSRRVKQIGNIMQTKQSGRR